MNAGLSLRFSLRSQALVVALAACACGEPTSELSLPGETSGLPEQVLEGIPEAAGGTVTAQGYERQGNLRSGFLRSSYEPGPDGSISGPVIKGFSLRSIAGGTGSVVDTGVVVEGTLQVQRSVLSGTTPSLGACATPTYGETRGCGWKSGGQWRCAPGASISLATGACGVSGAEDTMLRVCRGLAPCEYASTAKLASNDDACGTRAAHVTFTCPSTGVFSVLIAPYWSHQPLKSTVEAEDTTTAAPYFNVVQTGLALAGAPVEAIRTDGSVIPMRIAAVYDELGQDYVHPGLYGTGTTYRYFVQEPRADGQWEPLCGADVDAQDGGEGLPVAIPVTGWWDERASRNEDARLFTFSCGRGVITKCYRWGYRPWDEPSAQGTGLSAAMLHQTCTRMARADYCGNGQSWTQPNTPINLWDTAGIQTHDDPQQGHFFEAGWMPWGATCLHVKRWSNAPDDVFYEGCPNLFDHLQTPTGVERVPRYCENPEEALKKDDRTPLFNESAQNLFPPKE
jgi:hypothetical protein